MIHYISPSNFPSKTANSIHVLRQCIALNTLGYDVKLYGRRTVKKNLKEEIENSYGFSVEGLLLKTYYSVFSKGDNIVIAIFSIISMLFGKKPELILSRNLYATFVLSVILPMKSIYEVHLVETGWRKRLQSSVLRSKRVKTILISNKLREILELEVGIKIRESIVLHDAAPTGIKTLNTEEKTALLTELQVDTHKWSFRCGYFGHLYAGRGIELIEMLSSQLPNVLFLVVGGNDEEVKLRTEKNKNCNIRFIGHVSNEKALSLMRCFDVLLMPYQKKVTLGAGKFDTARWMSPMKMFEYLASGACIISSDLPVLREVLVQDKNAILKDPEDVSAWRDSIEILMRDQKLAKRLSQNARKDYLNKYSWSQRAESILNYSRK